jgi:hypothetical protein
MKASIYWTTLKSDEKSRPMEQRNGKQSRWMDCRETLKLLYMSSYVLDE